MASGGKETSRRIEVTPTAPLYLRKAIEDVGIQEWVYDNRRRKVSNPIVEQWIKRVQGERMDARSTPWCAYWVGAKLEEANISSTKSGMARSYLKWGNEVWSRKERWDPTRIREGDIAVFWRGTKDDNVTGHVGFIVDWDDDGVFILGGNQGDKVSVQYFSLRKLISVRREKSLWASKTMQSTGGAALTEGAKIAVQNTVPDVSAVPPVSSVPNPTDLQSGLDQARGPLEVLAQWKPEILMVLSILSLALIGYAAYCRYRANKNGGI